MNSRWLFAFAVVGAASCTRVPPQGGPRPPLPSDAIQDFRDEPPRPGTGDCRELGWAAPHFPPTYANPGCNNGQPRCPGETVCCSYRCIVHCKPTSEFGCPDYPICIEAARCRPGGRVDVAAALDP
jgi:hypothetical protein